MDVAPLTYDIGHSTPFETDTKEFSTMKTLLSIGSGPSIGLATAERFAAESYRAILTSRSREKLESLPPN
jgi:NADP-dependent 3-hydroxy acid dehydrogenase YdfG